MIEDCLIVNSYVSRIEKKWQEWARPARLSHRRPTRPTFYCLKMFAYPSATARGHVRTTVATSWPHHAHVGASSPASFGWDASLPAENAAIRNVHPEPGTRTRPHERHSSGWHPLRMGARTRNGPARVLPRNHVFRACREGLASRRRSERQLLRELSAVLPPTGRNGGCCAAARPSRCVSRAVVHAHDAYSYELLKAAEDSRSGQKKC